VSDYVFHANTSSLADVNIDANRIALATARWLYEITNLPAVGVLNNTMPQSRLVCCSQGIPAAGECCAAHSWVACLKAGGVDLLKVLRYNNATGGG